MKIKLCHNLVGYTVGLDRNTEILDIAGPKLFKNYKQLLRKDKAKLWHIDIDNHSLIEKVKISLQVYLWEGEKWQEKILCQGESSSDLTLGSFFILASFGDIAAKAEITHHTDSIIECSECKNKFQNPYFIPAIKPSLLPGSPKLMAFYGHLKKFCRPQFIDKYNKSGLTGFSFEDWGEQDKHGVPLFLVRTELHHWQDKEGVCEKCQMKTNVTTPLGIFNTHEQFQYDIQHVRTFGFDYFVLSRKAIEFLRETTKYMKTVLEEPLSAYPILPGYKEDIVWPEPKVFKDGEIPLYMLRSSWEKQ